MYQPHKILGVKANADIDEIKRAFRNQAKRLHPDVAQGAPGAADRFVVVKQAYETLLARRRNPARSEAQRAAHDGSPQPPPGSGSEAADPSRAEPAGPDTAPATAGRPKLWDAATWAGSRRTLGKAAKSLAQVAPLKSLSELGEPFAQRWGGRARHRTSQFRLKIRFAEAARGTVKRVRLSNGRPLDVEIPPGTEEGETLVVQMPDDLAREERFARTVHVKILYHPHDDWRRDGADVYLTLPVTVGEAVFGAKVEIRSLDGPLLLSIPPGSNAATKIRLKGKGWPKPDDTAGGLGDFFVLLKIVLPQASDADFRDAIKGWAAKADYKVR